MPKSISSRAVAAALLAIGIGYIGGPLAFASSFQAVTKGLPWSSRRLNWSDYRGTPDMSAEAAAMTVYQIDYAEECHGDSFSFSVVSRFQPERSWVRPAVLAAPARAAQLLDHEQLHFDLSEVHARQLRQWLAGLAHPCDMTTAQREKGLQDRVRDNAATQLRYDRETDFGRDARAQARWLADTTRALEHTASWSARGGWTRSGPS
ncbi:MAG TPA: DUF922 domain-containing protein [Vicinamibacterales bacterium]|nr:DUF922 domain-containing protein [Vicinamibacterales bacterium]